MKNKVKIYLRGDAANALCELLGETPTLDDAVCLELTGKVTSVSRYNVGFNSGLEDEASPNRGEVETHIELDVNRIDDAYYLDDEEEDDDAEAVEDMTEEYNETGPKGLNKLAENPALAKAHKKLRGKS